MAQVRSHRRGAKQQDLPPPQPVRTPRQAPKNLLEGLTAGKPLKDSDNDGMPDAWEKAHKLKANDPGDGNKIVPAEASPSDRHAGYTYVEYYLNELADRLVEGPHR